MPIYTDFLKRVFHELYAFRQLSKTNLNDINEDFPKILGFFKDYVETLTDISKEGVT
jgi:hypothetical protein